MHLNTFDRAAELGAITAPLANLPFSRFGQATVDTFAHDRLAGTLLFIGLQGLAEPLQRGWAVRDKADEARRMENAAIAATAMRLLPANVQKKQFLDTLSGILRKAPQGRKGESTPAAGAEAIANTGLTELFSATEWNRMVTQSTAKADERAARKVADYDARLKENGQAWFNTIVGEVAAAMRDDTCHLTPQRWLSVVSALESALSKQAGDTFVTGARSNRAEVQANMAIQAKAVADAIAMTRALGAKAVRDADEDRGRTDADLRDQGQEDFLASVDAEQFMETHALNGAQWAGNYVTGRPSVN